MSDQESRYPANPLTVFDVGANLDLRVRIAIQILSGPLLQGQLEWKPSPGGSSLQHGPPMVQSTPSGVALMALDVASELLLESERRGLIGEVPKHGMIDAMTRAHIERGVRANVFQQVAAQRVAREESPNIATMNG